MPRATSIALSLSLLAPLAGGDSGSSGTAGRGGSGTGSGGAGTTGSGATTAATGGGSTTTGTTASTSTGGPGDYCVGYAFVASCDNGIQCTDYYGSFYTAAALMGACGDTYSATACDGTGTVGSCVQEGPSAEQCGHVWAFPPSQTANVEAGCQGTNQTYFPP